MEKKTGSILKRLYDDGFEGHLLGTVALLACGCRAAAKEASGESWKPQRVAQEYADMKGCTMWAMWQRMDYAIRKAGVACGVGEYMRKLARGEE